MKVWIKVQWSSGKFLKNLNWLLILNSRNFYKLEILPINYLLGNITDGINLDKLAKLRESSTTTFNVGKLHRYKYFMVQLLPFLVIISFLKSKLSSKKMWYSIFILLTLLTMYRCISDLQKKPVLDFIILLFLTNWIIRGKINWKQVGILISFLLIALGLMYYYIMGLSHHTFYVLIDAIFTRIFLGQTIPLAHYFSLFPDIHDFLYGASLPNPAGLF